jgi:two-component system sensor histidine kinase SenX3
MRVKYRRKSTIFFIAFGACLVTIAVVLNVGWILLNWQQIALLILGIISFVAIIVGLVLNTIFLLREIRRNEQQDSFLSAVTHELKTPLASIRLYLETLQKRELDEAQRREFYEIMLADSERLLQTIETVLRAGSINERRFRRRLHTSIVDLGEMARECLEVARTRYRLDDDALSYKEVTDASHAGDEAMPNARPLVRGNPDELRAAISNLIDNAVKYSEGNVRVQVEVATLDRKRVAVRVRDAGIGIPSEQLKRLFKRFYRVPLPVILRVKGTGLGLFIVRTIAEKHGGRAIAESGGLGGGSTFTIQLPRAET